MAYSTSSCVGLICAALGATWIATSLRFYVRQVMLRNLSWDDIFSLFALSFFTAQGGLYLDSMVRYGLAEHSLPSTTAETLSKASNRFFFAELMFVLGTGSIKISFALTLMRIVRDWRHTYCLYFTIAVTTIMTAVTFFLVLFTCDPVNFFWRSYLELSSSGSCRSISVQIRDSYAHGAVMLFVDIILGILLPVHLLYTLQLKWRLKLVAGVVLSLGSFASVATIARLVYTADVDPSDILYTINVPFFWGGLELGICIICTSAATLKPLLTAFRVLNVTSSPNQTSYELEHGHLSSSKKGFSKNIKTIFSSPGTINEVNGHRSSTEEILWEGRDATTTILKTMSFQSTSVNAPTRSTSPGEAWANGSAFKTRQT